MNSFTLLFGIAALPVIILIIYIYKKDKVEKEPPKLLLKLFFVGGFLSAFIAICLEKFLDGIYISGIDSYMGLFIYSYFGIALIEELSKFLIIRLLTWKDKAFKHVFDGIVYAVFVSLGFAFIENIMYVFTYGFSSGITRGLTAIPGHCSFAVLMGAYYGLSKQADVLDDENMVNNYTSLALFLPITLHGIYDFLVLALDFNDLFVILVLACVIFLYFISYKKVKLISNVQNNFVLNDEEITVKED